MIRSYDPRPPRKWLGLNVRSAKQVVHSGGHKNQPALLGILVFRRFSRLRRSGEESPTLSASLRKQSLRKAVAPKPAGRRRSRCRLLWFSKPGRIFFQGLRSDAASIPWTECRCHPLLMIHRGRRTSVQHRPDGKPTRVGLHSGSLSNELPNHLLANEPSLSIQGIGGNCGR